MSKMYTYNQYLIDYANERNQNKQIINQMNNINNNNQMNIQNNVNNNQQFIYQNDIYNNLYLDILVEISESFYFRHSIFLLFLDCFVLQI